MATYYKNNIYLHSYLFENKMQYSAISKKFIKVVNSLVDNGLVKSKSQLAESLGTHRQSFNEIVNNKRNVTLELVEKIIEKYSVNASFLFSDSDEMFISSKENSDNIKFVPLTAHAGYGGQIQSALFESSLMKFQLPGSQYQNEEYRCFEIEGNSMTPSYISGDYVICSSIPNVYFEQVLKNYKTYIIVTQDSIFLKRIINNLKINKSLMLISDNEAFEPFEIAQNEILEIWKVESVITKRDFPYPKQ